MKLRCFTCSMIFAALLWLVSFAAGPVSAQIQLPVDIFPNFFGLGVGFITDYAGSNDYAARVAPGLRVSLPNNRFIEW